MDRTLRRRIGDVFLHLHENPIPIYILLFCKPIVDMFYSVSLLDYLMLGYAILLFTLLMVRRPSNLRQFRTAEYTVLGILLLLFFAFLREPAGFRIFVKTASMFLLFFIGRFCTVNTERLVRLMRLSFAIVVLTNLFLYFVGNYGILTSISYKEWGNAYTFCGLYYFKTDLAMAMLQALVFILAVKRPRFYDYVLACGALWLTLLSNTRISFAIAFILIGFSVLQHIECRVRRKFRIFDWRTVLTVFLCGIVAVASLYTLGKTEFFKNLGFLGLDVKDSSTVTPENDDVKNDIIWNGDAPIFAVDAEQDGSETVTPDDTSLKGKLIALFYKFYTPANTQGRSDIWRLVFERFMAGGFLDRLWGYDFVSDVVHHQANTNVSANAHNSYLKTLYSIGYLGVLLYAVFFFFSIRRAHQTKNRPAFFITLGLVSILLFGGLTNNAHEFTQMTWLPLFFLGLLFNKNAAEEVAEVAERGIYYRLASPMTAFLQSSLYIPVLSLLAVLIVLLEQQVAGTILFVLFLCYLLEEHEDITLTTAPFLLICVFDCMCYDSFNKFIGLWWLAIPAFGALIYRFIRYRHPFRCGPSLRGLLAVSVAITLGGLGFISAREYFNPIALYYTFGLGIGMILVYLAIKSQLGDHPSTAQKERFLVSLYAMGVIAAFCVLIQYAYRFETLIETKQVLKNIISRNNFSTFLIFAIPVPCYFTRRHFAHFFVPFLFFGCILLSGSRGGLLAAAITLVLSLIALILTTEDTRRRTLYTRIFICCLFGSLLLIAPVYQFFLSRLNPDGDLIDTHDTRMRFLRALWPNFKSNPIFGQGLGTEANLHLYTPKKGGLCWYHMMIPQIIGSLGLVGILGFGYQIYGRVRMILSRLSPYVICLALSYIGVFAMSQVNPGELCPLPYEMLVVFFFVLIESEEEKPFRDTLSRMWYNGKAPKSKN
ncbi:MAG: O-antigen ligase family protein [Clostridia bacterium]|nr:O-antigen ligase family protein [Clostridia bacterium]